MKNTFAGKEIQILVNENLSLLENLLKNEIVVDNICGGRDLRQMHYQD